MKWISYFTILGLLFIMISCTEIPTKQPSFPDYTAQVRFIHGAADVTGSQDLKIDGQLKGSLSFKGNTDYFELPAGSRQVSLGSETAVSVVIDADSRGTVLILNKEGNERKYIYFKEQVRLKGVVEQDTAKIRFVNAAPDTDFTVWALKASEQTITDSTFVRNDTTFKDTTIVSTFSVFKVVGVDFDSSFDSKGNLKSIDSTTTAKFSVLDTNTVHKFDGVTKSTGGSIDTTSKVMFKVQWVVDKNVTKGTRAEVILLKPKYDRIDSVGFVKSYKTSKTQKKVVSVKSVYNKFTVNVRDLLDKFPQLSLKRLGGESGGYFGTLEGVSVTFAIALDGIYKDSAGKDRGINKDKIKTTKDVTVATKKRVTVVIFGDGKKGVSAVESFSDN